MKFCDDHWDRLRTAINDNGLGALVSDSGEEVVHRLQRELGGEKSIDTFDPLMGAHNMIVANAVDLGGLVVLQQDGCPICYLNAEHERTCTGCLLPQVNAFDDWIHKAAEGQKTVWLKRAEGAS